MKELNASLSTEFSDYSISYSGRHIYANKYTSSDGNFGGDGNRDTNRK